MERQAQHGETAGTRLAGKVALVTGEDGGVGQAVALAFAREGADVALGYLEGHDDAKRTKALVEAAGRRALLLPGDLADEEHCHGLVDETVRRLGRLDVLVNDTGFRASAVGHLLELDPARLDRALRVSVLAMFHLVRWALPHLGPGATIINVSPLPADPRDLAASTAHAAMAGFTKALARQLAPRGVRVNAVAPADAWLRRAEVAQLAPTFVYLATTASSGVSGEVLSVTAGGSRG